MDILFTIVASIIMIVGFLVICRSSLDDDDEYEEDEEELAESKPRDETKQA